jgi:hypothetical protein
MENEKRIHDMCIAYATVKLQDLLPNVSEHYPNPSEAMQFELDSFHEFYMEALGNYSNIENLFNIKDYFGL